MRLCWVKVLIYFKTSNWSQILNGNICHWWLNALNAQCQTVKVGNVWVLSALAGTGLIPLQMVLSWCLTRHDSCINTDFRPQVCLLHSALFVQNSQSVIQREWRVAKWHAIWVRLDVKALCCACEREVYTALYKTRLQIFLHLLL